jgi:malate synthase
VTSSTSPRPASPAGPAGEADATLGDSARTPLAATALTPDALRLIGTLEREFRAERRILLDARRLRQRAWDAGDLPGYLPPGEHPDAHGDWRVAPLPEDLLRRRVEITGPISDPKMVVNMLSRTADGARADAAMLDFEDSLKPTWENVTRGVANLIAAVNGSLTHEKLDPDGRVVKRYELDPRDMPLTMVRVRGLHLDESNVFVDGQPVAAGLLDLTLAVFHTAHDLIASARTPKYYVPKVEHYLEARWWNRLLSRLEEELGLRPSALRATFLIETLPAAYQMEEILYELRDHAAGLNGGRWDKIFSDIKVLLRHEDRVLADRGSISMNRPWMRNYALRLIRICHKHGAFAMGGMAAFTPGSTPELRTTQTAKVVEDKELEASIGHDGCWVSHPYFIAPAMGPFVRANQLDVIPDEIDDTPDLLPRPDGPRTIGGLRTNVRVGIAYMAGWNADIGCVAWDGLMEDLATLEISRAQVWQWLHHRIALDDGTRVTPQLVESVFEEELEEILTDLRASGAAGGDGGGSVQAECVRYREGAGDALAIFTEARFREFLTCASEPAGADSGRLRAGLRAGSDCREAAAPSAGRNGGRGDNSREDR